MHVKQYGENKLDFTYKICELTVSTQEKDSGIMFYENKSVLEIRKANWMLRTNRKEVGNKHSYAAVQAPGAPTAWMLPAVLSSTLQEHSGNGKRFRGGWQKCPNVGYGFHSRDGWAELALQPGRMQSGPPQSIRIVSGIGSVEHHLFYWGSSGLMGARFKISKRWLLM